MLFHMIAGFFPRRTIMPNTSAIPGKPKNKIQPATLKNEIGDGPGREELISVAAYYLAEYRGFGGGDPLADWLSAESTIDAMHKDCKKIKI
jgi:hypothetical protein